MFHWVSLSRKPLARSTVERARGTTSGSPRRVSMIVTRFVRVCGARGWFGVLRQVMKATERTFFLDGRARVDRYSHRKWCLRGHLSRSGDGLIVAKIGRKPGIPALRVTGKGSGCIRCMIVSVCSAFWLFLREKVLIAAKSGGKATVCMLDSWCVRRAF